jgi:hypothetical protein
MNPLLLGLLLGVAVGVVDVLLMLPMSFPNRTTALLAAFFSRFAIGFLAVNVKLPFHPALAGALVGLLISIPDTIVTKTYAPILITGIIFGALVGWAGHHWAA